MHCQTKTDFAQAVGGWEVSRNGCFLTSTAFAREERVSDYLDAASQGQFPLPRTPTGPDTERGPVEGINGRAGWSPQDTRPGSCCWLPAEFPCVQPKTLSTKRPSIALGSPGQPQAPVPDLSCNKERGRRASLVAQWLRICLLMQGTRVRALVWEDPTCHGAAGPVSHNC